MRGQKRAAREQIVFYLIDNAPTCVWCTWELSVSGFADRWWRAHVEPVTEQQLVTARWTAELGTVTCRVCKSTLLVSEVDRFGQD